MNKIVACVDGAGYTGSVCDYAAWAAGRLNAALEFLHVLIRPNDANLDASGSIGLGAQEALLAELANLDEQRSVLAREHGRRLLEAARDRALAQGVTDVDVRQSHGDLIEALQELEASTRLFVMGQHDEQARPRRFLLDHNLESAVRTVQRPVLVTSARFTPPKSFMIAFDASATARRMVDRVAESPILSGLRCHIVTVGGDPAPLEWARKHLSESGFDVQAQRLEGEAAGTLIGFAEREQLDMMVMGAYGHSRIRQWVVGSTTTALLRQTRIPAFILR